MSWNESPNDWIARADKPNLSEPTSKAMSKELVEWLDNLLDEI
jgi:hypothetical protein